VFILVSTLWFFVVPLFRLFRCFGHSMGYIMSRQYVLGRGLFVGVWAVFGFVLLKGAVLSVPCEP